jgi:hypothetical protein
MSWARSLARSSAAAVLLCSALAFGQAEEAPEEYQPPPGVPMSPEPSHAASQQEASDHRWLVAVQPRFVIGLSGAGELPRIGYGFGLNVGRALVVRGAVRLGIGASFAYDRVAYGGKQDAQQNISNAVESIAHASFSADVRLDALLLAGRIRPWAMLGPALSVATYSEPAPTQFSANPSSTHALPGLRAAVGLAGLVWRSLELGAHLEWLVTFDGPSLGTPPVQPLTPGTFSVGLDVGFRF